MPVAFISTRTSPAFGPSRSTSTISSGFFASNATAARVFICHISLKNLAWPGCSYFRVPCSAATFRPVTLSGRGHNLDCENLDEHPSCSRALHSRAERQGWRCQTYLFFYRMRHWSKTSECRVCVLTISLRCGNENKMCRIAARKSGRLLGVTNIEPVARLCAAMSITISREPRLCYNIHQDRRRPQQRAQWDETDGRSILVSCAGIGRPISW